MFRLLSSPSKEWGSIENQRKTESDFLNRFLFPIFGFISLNAFIAGMWFYVDGNLLFALKLALIQIVAVFVGYYLSSSVLSEIAPRFELKENILQVQQFVGYSSVVMYVLFLVTPFFSKTLLLWILSLYTIYIVYEGSKPFLHISESKRKPWTVIASLMIILIPLISKKLLELLII